MAGYRIRSVASVALAFFAVPWTAFVAAFLYYVGLTMLAISGEQLTDLAVAATYLVPVAAYALLLATRVTRALAAVPVQIGQLAMPRLQ